MKAMAFSLQAPSTLRQTSDVASYAENIRQLHVLQCRPENARALGSFDL